MTASSKPLARCVGGGDAGVDRHHHDLAAVRVELLDRVEGGLAAADVVGGDRRGGERRVLGAWCRPGRPWCRPRRPARAAVCMAVTSVGAIRMASGLVALDRVEDRPLQGRVELLRALGVDRDAELGRLGLDAALHGDVELVAGDALDELDVVVLRAFAGAAIAAGGGSVARAGGRPPAAPAPSGLELRAGGQRHDEGQTPPRRRRRWCDSWGYPFTCCLEHGERRGCG